MQVEFIEVKEGQKDFSVVGAGDVVILPAFGASVQEMQLLKEGCTIVDTTCPWVPKSGIPSRNKRRLHGKYNHEETIATSSVCY